MKRPASVSRRKLEFSTPSAIPLNANGAPRSKSDRRALSSSSVMSVYTAMCDGGCGRRAPASSFGCQSPRQLEAHRLADRIDFLDGDVEGLAQAIDHALDQHFRRR